MHCCTWNRSILVCNFRNQRDQTLSTLDQWRSEKMWDWIKWIENYALRIYSRSRGCETVKHKIPQCHQTSESYSNLIAEYCHFQSGACFLWFASTHNHVTVHMEPSRNFYYDANYPSGISWVESAFWVLKLVWFDFYPSISAASWQYFAIIDSAFEWTFRICHSIHCVWAWSKDERCVRTNRYYDRTITLVFVSIWNTANATNDHRECTTAHLIGMLWRYRMYSWHL